MAPASRTDLPVGTFLANVIIEELSTYDLLIDWDHSDAATPEAVSERVALDWGVVDSYDRACRDTLINPEHLVWRFLLEARGLVDWEEVQGHVKQYFGSRQGPEQPAPAWEELG